MTLSLEEILKHPGFPDVMKIPEPTAAGKATVAKGRRGGPLSLAYEVHGLGPTHIVWIMGMNGPKIAWHRQTKYFGHERREEFTSLVYDHRGVCDSDTPWARLSTSEMAKDVIDLVDYLGWTGAKQLHVVGVSMGGMIAQELACLVPERIASLTLQSTASVLTADLPWHKHLVNRISMLIPKSLPERLESVKQYLFSQEWLDKPDDAGVFPTNADRFVAEELWRIDNLRKAPFQGWLLQGLAASWHSVEDHRLEIMGKNIPHIMVCVGGVDKMIPPFHSDVLFEGLSAGNKAVKKVVYDRLGHALQAEAGDEYNKMIEGFVLTAQNA